MHRHIPAIKNRAEHAHQTGGTVVVDAEPLLELIRDAERYQWLRHGDNDDLVLRRCLGSVFVLRTEQLDAVIDEQLTHSAPLKDET